MKFLLGIMVAMSLVWGQNASASDNTVREIIEKNDTQAFSNLYILGYDVDQFDSDGLTALMLASSLGKDQFVSFLIANNVKIDKRNSKGETALHLASFNGHSDVISILIEDGANPNMPDIEGMTPLMKATMRGHLGAVKTLLDKGANLGFKNAKGESAVDIAKKLGLKEVRDFLQSKGAVPSR